MNRRLKRSAARHGGFSLLELLIAMAMLAMAVSAGYEALRGGLRKLAQLSDVSRRSGDSAAAMALLARDLRGATLAGDQSIFSGHDDVLRFSRMSESGVEPVDYYRLDGALWRSAQNKNERICDRVDAFDLRYFDGRAWRDQWGWDDERRRPLDGIRGLPRAVSIHLVAGGRETTVGVPVMTALLNAAS